RRGNWRPPCASPLPRAPSRYRSPCFLRSPCPRGPPAPEATAAASAVAAARLVAARVGQPERALPAALQVAGGGLDSPHQVGVNAARLRGPLLDRTNQITEAHRLLAAGVPLGGGGEHRRRLDQGCAN